MTAKQLKYFGPRKSRAATRRRRRAGKKSEVVILSQNPRRRHMAKRRRRHSKRRRLFARNPRRRVRRFRRNPISSTQGFLGETFMPAVAGAAGAVGADLLLGMLPTPMMWQGGPGTQTLARILASLGVGWLVGAVTTEKYGADAAAGGIIVALYQLFRPWASQNLPFRMARYVPLGAVLRRRGRGRMRRYVPMKGMRRGGAGNMMGPAGATRLRNRAGLGLKGMGRVGAYNSPARTSGPNGGLGRAAMARYIAHANQ
jgi:hypothetical protein